MCSDPGHRLANCCYPLLPNIFVMRPEARDQWQDFHYRHHYFAIPHLEFTLSCGALSSDELLRMILLRQSDRESGAEA
jgi:hypothetical protein